MARVDKKHITLVKPLIFLKTNLMMMTLCLYQANDDENNFSMVIAVVLISTIRIVMTTIIFMNGGEK